MRLQGVGQCPMRDVEIQVSDIISAHDYLRGVMSAALQQCLFFNILLSLTVYVYIEILNNLSP